MSLTSCSYFTDTEEVIFDASDLGSKTYKVVYIDKDISAKSFIVKDADSFSITLSKNYAIPVLVYPVEDGKTLSRPYGAVYPYSNIISFKDGFSAFITLSLYLYSEDARDAVRDYISYFNWERFISVIQEYEDPWKLDATKIIDSIKSGSFRITDIKICE